VHSSLFYTGQTSSSTDENHFGFTEVSEAGFMRAAMKTACPWLAELSESITRFLPEKWGAGRLER